ncbi:DUF4340 domain-containing protein [Acidobacteriota bacterium]
MKWKKEYVVLFGIIAVLLIYLVFSGGKNKMSYEVPKIQKIEKDELNKIEILKEGKTITLAGQGDSWKILPQEFPADKDKVNQMLEVIEDLTLTELAAEKKGYSRYELDEEKKILVKAYKSEELKREFDVGKTSSTYSHTFVKLGDDSRVYHARGSFRSKFDLNTDELREKLVMKFDKNEITEVGVTGYEEDLRFTKKMKLVETKVEDKTELETEPEPKQEESWVNQDEKEGNKSEIQSVLSELSNLKCDQYIEEQTKEDFSGPIYTVALKGIKDYLLQIFEKDEEEGKYPAISSENQYLFFLSSITAENIMKKPEDLTKAE